MKYQLLMLNPYEATISTPTQPPVTAVLSTPLSNNINEGLVYSTLLEIIYEFSVIIKKIYFTPEILDSLLSSP